MHFSILLLICSLFYLCLIGILFFTKQKIKSTENKIYSFLIVVTAIGIIMDILGIYAHFNLADTSILRWLIVKLYLLYLLAFVFLITTYIISLEKQSIPNKIVYILYTLFIVSSVLNFILPFKYVNDDRYVYIVGPNTIFLYGVAAINIIFWIIYILKNIKTIKIKKFLPIITFIIIVLPVIIVQLLRPELLLVTSLSCFVVVFMYHTIENPDLKMINELNIAKDAAEKANNFKTEFLSNMSHEIRTPLNAIVGFSESLTDENLPIQAKESVQNIVMASDNLLELVNSILDISKIEANKIEIKNTDYSTEVLVNELIALTKGRLGDKPLDFRTSFDASLPKYLHGDHQRLKQIIINLLTNSVKYTNEGYLEFKINCVQKNNICRLIISVEDSGIGIKPEKIDKLFTKFERLDIQNNTTAEGTGLGLAITKKLVELMGGKIICQSVYGKGSRFTVVVNQKIVTGTPKITNQGSIKKTKLDLTKVDYSNKKILLVDDNVVNLKVAAKLLQPYKVNVVEVTSGIECIELINQGQHFDMIFMDDMMPKMKGTEALNILKEDQDFNIPVVALTANAISGMREKYLEDGFDDYLAKPIDRNELNRVIKKFFD